MQTNKPSTILITGCSGFIGTKLVEKLHEEGYVVWGVDLLPTSLSMNDFHFVNCDILNSTGLRTVLSDCQPHDIVHLAARTDLDGRSVSDYAANVEGVHSLVEAVAATPSVQRCIYTSSQLVCCVGYVPESELEYCPDTPYGESKVLMEGIVRQEDGGGVEWCLARPTTVWGPGMSPHYQRLFRMISRRRYFHVGSRPSYKSYSYIGNIVYQYQQLLKSPAELIHRKTFYLADYQPISLRAWIDTFQNEMGARRVPIIAEHFAKVAACVGDVINMFGFKKFPFNSFRLNNIMTEYIVDMSAIEHIVGPLPYTTRQGVKETVAWLFESGILNKGFSRNRSYLL